VAGEGIRSFRGSNLTQQHQVNAAMTKKAGDACRIAGPAELNQQSS